MVGGVYAGLKPVRLNTNSGSKEGIETNSGRVLSDIYNFCTEMVGGLYSGLKPIRLNTNSGSKEGIETNLGRVLSK